ncbi:SDR family NAD(P)-dependent oxidoreductase [Streptomonospora salina]|uniref:NAD(P)-dependent dehydrogenase (Short-subunit alcohol dehydrogenase family) n=1 Tax=Streptomonospora salina TaxID=104205 RepID=A0A841E2S7_9ACTN|nr:SDR family NAD(P)-dependent oxidoreductase [Streptomonospora salina]MBB5997002.1 NAD(P)-dependent dehydrogenase (short-subunit alcohol dehydrogenase family) [Streptomonospora salina]
MSESGLNGTSTIVTGGGSGIGRAAALRLAGEGARVLVADIDEETAQSAAAEIRSAGGTAEVVAGDLSDQAVVDRVAATAAERFGSVDVLVNNAGIMDDMSAAADVGDAVWERLIRINLTAPFLLTRAVLPHMLQRGGGSIVFTASEASLRGSAAGTAYTAAKHGVVGLVKSTAIMYRDQGVRVNAVAPGGTATNIDIGTPQAPHGPTVLGGYGGNIGRISHADELAAAIAFLASDAAGAISGTVLPVDNGWSAV